MLSSKQFRAVTANAFLTAVARCGRQFFRHSDSVSLFEVDNRGRVWFHDAYSKKRIYTNYRYAWRGFTEGGTLRALVERLRDYIRTGAHPRLPLGPWPAHYCNGDLWGYGTDMQQVRDAAERLFGSPNATTNVTSHQESA